MEFSQRFKVDFTTRYTFWNGLFQGIFIGFGTYGSNQTAVQRLLSLSNKKRAKRALLFSIPFVAILTISSCLHGIVLYAVYFMCDPVLNSEKTGLTKYDQIVPYYLVSKFHSIPGLTGLSIAGIFSASLTSVSSVLNSLATTTVVDFVHPNFQYFLINERRSLLLAKGLSLAYGVISICIAFTLTKVDSISQVGFIFNSTFEGPTLAVFIVGVLTTKGFGRSLLFGLLVGFSLTQWIGFSSVFSGYAEPLLPLNITMCTSSFNSTYEYSTHEISNIITPSTMPLLSNISEIFVLNKISYFWMRPIGFVITICCIYITILITGWKTSAIPPDSKCLSPVVRLWTNNPKTGECQNGKTDRFRLESLHCRERQ